ncbi:MAG: hydrogenase nickel incorporation protein HypA [candidate division WOR-3 bacterium]
MHEWALAEAIVNTVLRYKEENRLLKVNKVLVKLGSLQEIEKEVLISALEEFLKMKKLKVQFIIEEEEASFKCRICGEKWNFRGSPLNESERERVHFIPELIKIYCKCPSCGSSDFEVLKGRGVWIEWIKGESLP